MEMLVRAAVLVSLLLFCNALLDLMGPNEMEGVWKGSAVLPCTYVPGEDFVQHTLTWSVVHDQSSGTVFRRDASGDHVLLSEYRNRVEVPKNLPGNVSLHILKLEISDRGTYTCHVTWTASNNSLIAKEISTKVEVVKVPATKPIIRAGALGLTVPVGARTSLTCVAHGSPPISYRWFRAVPGGTALPLSSQAELTWDSLRPSDAGTYYCEAENRVGAGVVQRSDAVELVVRGSPVTQPPTPGTSRHTGPPLPSEGSEAPHALGDLSTATLSARNDVVSERAPAATDPPSQSDMGTSETYSPTTDLPVTAVNTEKGVGYTGKNYTTQSLQKTHLSLYMVILIAVLCGAVVFLVIFTIVCIRKPKEAQVYEVEHSNSMKAGASSRYDSVAHYEEPLSSTENNYVMEPMKNERNKENEYKNVGNTQESEYEVGDSK
ncbi:V-set and immunoglobulin domain-containing protein 4 isoform X1 [Anas platyrhynchos]|uniref:V-set and immunoglobulin domain-containing protein 4 isoform X1 n=1 Tax=Anas platyrhynchos TaxID=8839 RepID=UPI003AF227F0